MGWEEEHDSEVRDSNSLWVSGGQNGRETTWQW